MYYHYERSCVNSVNYFHFILTPIYKIPYLYFKYNCSMWLFKFLTATSLLFVALNASAIKPDPAKRVILIGIDGISAEGLQYSDTPILNNLISGGVLSLKTRGVIPTLSAPNWATILSGAGPEQHGVTSNNWSLFNRGFDPTTKDEDGYFTSIFMQIRRQLPKAVTAMFYDWDWLGTFVNPNYVNKTQFVEGPVMITSVALNYIRKEKPIFTFIYYGLPKEIIHSKGYGTPEYFESINSIDTEIGKLIAGIKESGMDENTTIIITSGPGSMDSGQVTESIVLIEVPWIIAGPGIKKNMLLEAPNDLTNTTPTIAKILGLKIPNEWIGRPVNEAFISKVPPTKTNSYVPKPFCSLNDGAFPGPQQIELSTKAQKAAIYYTLDGTSPGINSKKYLNPFTINSNCQLKAVTISGSFSSQTITRMYTFIQGIKSAVLTAQPSNKYPGSGISGLFDGLIGSSSPANKQWIGYEGDDFEVTIDLGEKKVIKMLGIDVLQLPEAWIFLPSAVEFYASDDGKSFRLLNTFYPSETDDIRLDGPVMLSRNFENLHARHIRITAKNIGVCPPTHPGEGKKAWLLVSEVEIE